MGKRSTFFLEHESDRNTSTLAREIWHGVENALHGFAGGREVPVLGGGDLPLSGVHELALDGVVAAEFGPLLVDVCEY